MVSASVSASASGNVSPQCTVTYKNTSWNVDVPEPGSSRYIETQSPADSHYQSYQVYPPSPTSPASPTLPASPALLHRSPCRPPILRLSNQQIERINRTILEKVRCLLFTANLLKYLQGEVVSIAVYLYNRTLYSQLQFKTPY